MINKSALEAVVARFGEVSMAVIGDVMLDQFIWGKVDRISPEAPVPVVQVTRESVHLGGAANVVANIMALGGSAIPVGLVGQDSVGDQTLRLLDELGARTAMMVRGRDYASIQKTRVIAHHQQVCRVDREPGGDPTAHDQALLMQRVVDSLEEVTAVIVSDYGKGVVNEQLLNRLRQHAKKPRIYVDPKDRNFNHYHHVSALTPNQSEAERLSGIKINDVSTLKAAAGVIFERLSPEQLLVTLGENGMALFLDAQTWTEIPTLAREVYDVSGAGDTVIATFALACQAGADGHQAAVLANLAAGIVVGKLGTACVCQTELINAIRQESNLIAPD